MGKKLLKYNSAKVLLLSSTFAIRWISISGASPNPFPTEQMVA
jgi:hypothetical protein